MLCKPFSASLLTYASPQASVEPVPPPLHILSKANDVAVSLIKPTSTCAEAAQTLLRWPKLAAWMESVAKKIESC